jgi:hypothetical protein
MFRHSEIESLRREQAKRPQVRPSPRTSLSSGEIEDDKGSKLEKTDEHRPPTTIKTQKKNQGSGRQKKQEPKPDLRKRTWDVVGSGLNTLEYDD